jgi:hypothetical protein
VPNVSPCSCSKPMLCCCLTICPPMTFMVVRDRFMAVANRTPTTGCMCRSPSGDLCFDGLIAVCCPIWSCLSVHQLYNEIIMDRSTGIK